MFAHLALVLIAGIWLPRAAGRLVPARGAAAGIAHGARSTSDRARPGCDAAIAAAGATRRALTLLGLWGDAGRVHMAVLDDGTASSRADSRLRRTAAIRRVGAVHPPALRLERAIARSVRPRCRRARRTRVRGSITAVWPNSRHGAGRTIQFLPVEGEGLHQIPVGPVHAGIIEPGHFRFTANGETVVRLEQRLGYVHKGIDRLMRGATIERGRQARRPHVAATAPSPMRSPSRARWRRRWALQPPPRAAWLRGVMAELERLANHLGDIGAICNDASFRIMLAHCGMLRERVLRAADACFGHRLMMDCVVPGGVAAISRRTGRHSAR